MTAPIRPFLVMAGANYYPISGSGDWQSFHDTREEAEAEASKLKSQGNWGAFDFDWVEVIDLAAECERLTKREGERG